MSALNLLDLPVMFIEDVLTDYVKSKESLKKLTECNSSIKNIIETSPFLMRYLLLRIRATYGKMTEKQKEIFKVCMNSTRRYQAVSLEIKSDLFWNGGNPDPPEYSLKKLVDKHAQAIKDFKMSFKTNREEWIVDVLSYLENLSNVEKIVLQLGSYDKDIITKNNSANCFATKFNRLKFLELDINYYSVVFDVFRDCKTLTCLRLEAGENLEDITKFYPLLENSEKTLQSLNIELKYDFFGDKINMWHFTAAGLLRKLKNLKLDLKYFEFHLGEINHENLIILMEFLGSQRNLETFKYCGEIDLNFFDYFQSLMPGFENLKHFEVTYYFNEEAMNRDEDEERSCRVWDLRNLKKVNLFGGIGFYVTDVFEKMFSTPSEELEVIRLDNAYLHSLECITINYPNLTELILEGCDNHSCNDIFLIMKSLKKLRILRFEFHEEYYFDGKLFENNGDLTLPEIREVVLIFNKYVKNIHVKKFMQCLKTMSDFCFWYWSGDIETLRIIIEEIPNLRKLGFGGHSGPDYDDNYIDQSKLKIIEGFVQKSNNNPELFKLRGKSFEENLIESQENAKRRYRRHRNYYYSY